MALVVFVETEDVARSHGGLGAHLRRESLEFTLRPMWVRWCWEAEFEEGPPKTFYGNVHS
jgi:hypothetical protein